jgi:RNA polymerase sigma factor (TIGR02999 family)
MAPAAAPRPSPAAADVTALLHRWRAGEDGAAERLLAAVYPDLHRLARGKLFGERAAHTFQPTDLVHEAYLRLVDQGGVDWRDRAHFFAIAATCMRRVLVDHARARLAAKRAHDPVSLTLAGGQAEELPEVEVLDLDRALGRLAEAYPRHARVVELRYFSGLEVEEIAAVLGVSDRTVKRDWSFARAWLLRDLGRPAAAP